MKPQLFQKIYQLLLKQFGSHAFYIIFFMFPIVVSI